MSRILILNGPNLNILGRRLPGICGDKTLEEINEALTDQAQKLGIDVSF